MKVANHVNGIDNMTCDLNYGASLMNEMMSKMVEEDEGGHHLFMELLTIWLRIGLDLSLGQIRIMTRKKMTLMWPVKKGPIK